MKLKTTGPIHESLTGYDFREDEPLTPRQAIRKKCLECCCGSTRQIKTCQIHDCTLWPFRLGHGTTKDPGGEKVRMSMRGYARTEAESCSIG